MSEGKSMFDISINLEKDILNCEIILNQKMEDDVEYAFYLLLNKEKIDIRYFSKDSNTQFLLTADGEYSVVGFVKHNGEKIIKTSDIIECFYDKNNEIKKKQIEISIFGSCVSRDVFDFDKLNRFNINTYIARQSVVSAVSKPLECNIEDIKLKSKFQRQAVYDDFKKSAFEKFKNDKSEYLLIDLIDERFKLILHEVNGIKSIVTYSSCLLESEYINNPNFLQRNKKIFGGKDYVINNRDLCEYMKDFIDKILKIYTPSKIILHKIKMSNYYIDIQGDLKRFPLNHLRNNKAVNDLLSYMYSYFEEKIEDVKVIDISEYYYADESHKWGISPMHYQKEYYEDVLKELNKLHISSN